MATPYRSLTVWTTAHCRRHFPPHYQRDLHQLTGLSHPLLVPVHALQTPISAHRIGTRLSFYRTFGMKSHPGWIWKWASRTLVIGSCTGLTTTLPSIKASSRSQRASELLQSLRIINGLSTTQLAPIYTQGNVCSSRMVRIDWPPPCSSHYEIWPCAHHGSGKTS